MSERPRDLVLDAVAQENAELHETVDSLRADIVVYRRMVSALLTRAKALKDETEMQREQMWIWRRDRANEHRRG